jgi:hypothetical protein
LVLQEMKSSNAPSITRDNDRSSFHPRITWNCHHRGMSLQ